MPGKPSAGAAYVFTRSGDSWRQQARLLADDAKTADYLGQAVAVSGGLVLLGAPYRDNGARVSAGAAYAFTRSGATWTQQAVIVARDGSDHDYFGSAVAVSGVTAIVGAPEATVSGKQEAGAVYVYARPGAVWAEQAKLVATLAAESTWFGYSVSCADESVLIGAPGHTLPLYPGAAYLFTKEAGTWSLQDKLTGAIAGHDAVGDSVALSGVTYLVGAPYREAAGEERAGAAYVFVSAPAISGFAPPMGPVGTTVAIRGSGLAGATAVSFNGAAATFTVDSDARITTTVPPGAATGAVTITNKAGSTASGVAFAVIPRPRHHWLHSGLGRRRHAGDDHRQRFHVGRRRDLQRHRRPLRGRRREHRHGGARRRDLGTDRGLGRRRHDDQPDRLHCDRCAHPHGPQARVGQAPRDGDPQRRRPRRDARCQHGQVRQQDVQHVPLLERRPDRSARCRPRRSSAGSASP